MRGDSAEKYGEALGFSIKNPVQNCKHFEKTKNILKNTIEHLKDKSCGYFGVLSALYKLMELSTAGNDKESGIQIARKLIDENYTLSDFKVSELCRDVGFSHAQLLRLFKKAYGKTVRRYIIEKRLALASELLENTDLSVRSVAFSCGFSDEIHFMKSFKEYFNKTASEYRKLLN